MTEEGGQETLYRRQSLYSVALAAGHPHSGFTSPGSTSQDTVTSMYACDTQHVTHMSHDAQYHVTHHVIHFVTHSVTHYVMPYNAVLLHKSKNTVLSTKTYIAC